MFCTREKKEETENKKHSCALDLKTNPSGNSMCEKDGRESDQTPWAASGFGPSQRDWMWAAMSQTFFAGFFFKKKEKKRERSNSCSRANTPGPKTAGGQRLMHSSDSSLRGPTMTPRHPKNTSWGRRSRTRKGRRRWGGGFSCSFVF